MSTPNPYLDTDDDGSTVGAGARSVCSECRSHACGLQPIQHCRHTRNLRRLVVLDELPIGPAVGPGIVRTSTTPAGTRTRGATIISETIVPGPSRPRPPRRNGRKT